MRSRRLREVEGGGVTVVRAHASPVVDHPFPHDRRRNGFAWCTTAAGFDLRSGGASV